MLLVQLLLVRLVADKAATAAADKAATAAADKAATAAADKAASVAALKLLRGGRGLLPMEQ